MTVLYIVVKTHFIESYFEVDGIVGITESIGVARSLKNAEIAARAEDAEDEHLTVRIVEYAPPQALDSYDNLYKQLREVE